MAKKGADMHKAGHYAFIVGLVLAVVAALIPWFTETTEGRITAIGSFAVLGIIVGLMNITAKETTEFLVAALVLIIALATTNLVLGLIPVVGEYLVEIWGFSIVFIALTAIVVSVKAIIALAEK